MAGRDLEGVEKTDQIQPQGGKEREVQEGDKHRYEVNRYAESI